MPAKNEYRILIADDNPDNLKVLSSMLEKQGYKIRVALNGEQVLKSIAMMAPDLIMLDIHMPILDGYETCKALKSDKRFCDIPVIFISAMSEAFNKLLAFDSGGIDYIVKPFQLEEVHARVKTHLALKEYQRNQQRHIDLIRECLLNAGLDDAVKKIEHAHKCLCQEEAMSKEQQEYLDIIGVSIQTIITAMTDLSQKTDALDNTNHEHTL